MSCFQTFCLIQLEKVDEAALLAEDLVYNHFKLSSTHWLKNRYDIKTAKDLAPHEIINGPFAQVIKYEGRKKGDELNSSAFSLYAVCIQDKNIISFLQKNKQLLFEPFLLYVLVHELIHVVRFLKFEHRYENASEISVTVAEERIVHRKTHTVLSSVSVPGMQQVLNFSLKWISYDQD